MNDRSPTPTEQAIKWRELPFHIKHLYNDNWYPGEEEKKYMPEESYKSAMDAYAQTEKDVVFEDIYVSHDSCDCSEYGCSHGRWPFEVVTKDKSETISFEDAGLYFEKDRKTASIPDLTLITLGHFYDLCSVVGIKLTVRLSYLNSPTVEEQAKDAASKYATEGVSSDVMWTPQIQLKYNGYLVGHTDGHASRNSEVEELWQGIEILKKEKREYIHKAACLQSDLNLAKRENDEFKARINELESSNIVFSQTVAIDLVTDTEDDIYDAVAQYMKDHSNDTEGSKGGGC